MASTGPDTLGLTYFHCPEEAVVDICFVHGIGGGNVSTWASKDNCWPRDLLPNDIPDARIISWGYKAKVAEFWSVVSQDSAEKHANNLTASLVSDRAKHKTQRPIIFVAHSLGGLVCAQALLEAHGSSEENDKAIQEFTRCIAFLGTPFQGSDMARWAESLQRLVLLHPTNRELLSSLKKDSPLLAKISEKFPNWLRGRAANADTKVDIVCFTEAKEMKGVGKVVTDDAAHIKGYPAFSLNANHQDMCKFSGKEDNNYRTVRDVLQRSVKECQCAER
ncbi:MAG: hypothetical protein Q9222_001613 [Ikaeria aurantiellina]